MQNTISLPRTLCLLTLLLIIAQWSYFIITLLTSGMLHAIIKHALATHLFLSLPVLLPTLLFFATQLFIYSVLIVFIFYLANNIATICQRTKSFAYTLGILLWISAVLFMFTANSHFFNLSLFVINTNYAWHDNLVYITYISTGILLTICTILALLVSIHSLVKRKNTYTHLSAILLAGTISIPFIVSPSARQSPPIKQTNPNIFLVSIEALRPDFITPNTMPFLHHWLSGSVNFTNTYTPIAQSFPAWMSILTSKTPKHSGARSLYINTKAIDLKETLVTKLNTIGYETFYAVDGQRFGEITEDMGFQHIVSPPYGAAELLIGSISDFPLLNLITLTPLAKYLLPYSFANRSIITTYDPKQFNAMIRDAIHHKKNQPLLFAVHFGLSHWPFRWANDQQDDNATLPERYATSLKATDQQLSDFFTMLEQRHLLENTIVIILSDHGIGLGLKGDRLLSSDHIIGDTQSLSWQLKSPYSTHDTFGIDTSYGYSTDILSLVQYHALLAFKDYRHTEHHAKTIVERTSLLDIAPTILDLISQPPLSHIDGRSLLPYLTNQHNLSSKRRIFFLENGFTTSEIAKADISIKEVLKDAPNIEIDPDTGLLYISNAANTTLLKNKQRAVLLDDWLLARYPARIHTTLSKSSTTPEQTLSLSSKLIPAHFVLVNIKTHDWTTDFTSSLANSAPLPLLMGEFTEYFNDELDDLDIGQ